MIPAWMCLLARRATSVSLSDVGTSSFGRATMAVHVQRKGKTAKDWVYADEAVVFGWKKDGTVQVRFDMDSKGGGITQSKLRVTNESFAELALAMVQADRESAISAFGK